MKCLVINNETKSPGKLKALLKKLGVKQAWYSYDDFPDYKNYDFIILTGSSSYNALWDTSKFKKEIHLIKTTTNPVLGICFGFELICLANGSKLIEMEEGAQEDQHIEVVNNDKIFGDIKNITVHESHNWAVTDLGNKLLGLARSQFGWEVVKHRDRPLYGIQFHPEIDTELTQGDDLLRNFILNVKPKQPMVINNLKWGGLKIIKKIIGEAL